MRRKERLFEIFLGIIINIMILAILLGLYVILETIVLSLVLLLILSPVIFLSTRLIYRPREKYFTINHVRKKVLKFKKRRFLARILGI